MDIAGIKKENSYAAKVLLKGLTESYANEEQEREIRLRKLAKIREKFLSGARLTGREMDFLAAADPSAYEKVRAVAAQRAALEQAMKHAKSKEEAQRIFEAAMGTIQKPEEDPMAEAKMHQFENAKKEYKKTEAAMLREELSTQPAQLCADFARQSAQLEALTADELNTPS